MQNILEITLYFFLSLIFNLGSWFLVLNVFDLCSLIFVLSVFLSLIFNL